MEPASRQTIRDLSNADHESQTTAILTSEADTLILVANAATGLTKRERWTITLACLAAIPHLIVIIDNMEQIGWSMDRFRKLEKKVAEKRAAHDCKKLSVVPADFRQNKSIHALSEKANWYSGPTLATLLHHEAQEGNPATNNSQSSDQFASHICWLADKAMLPGRHYQLSMPDGQVDVSISNLKYRLIPEGHQAAEKLQKGEVAYVNLSLEGAIEFEPFNLNRGKGFLLLFDKKTNTLAAVCLIKHALRRATNIHWQTVEINKQSRAKAMNQRPCVLWFTGLSGSGKSSIASLVEKELHRRGFFTYLLDGDNVRHGLCRDLGFTDADRVENLRRISETSKLFVDAGLIVLASFISPFRAERLSSRNLFESGEFMEIFVDTPLEVCEQRDPKGLYRLARAGKLANFTGLDSPYETPVSPELVLKGDKATPEDLAFQVIQEMEKRQLIRQ